MNEARKRKCSCICLFLLSSCSTDLVRVGSIRGNWHLCHPFLLPYFLLSIQKTHTGDSVKKCQNSTDIPVPTIISQHNRVISSPKLVFGTFSQKAINGGSILWKKENWVNYEIAPKIHGKAWCSSLDSE